MTPTDQSNTDSNAYTQGVKDALFDPSKHSETEIAERNARVAAATKTNVQKMQIANSNAKAGSEVRDIDAPKLAGSEEETRTSEKDSNEVRKLLTDKFINLRPFNVLTIADIDYIMNLIAQLSAQVEKNRYCGICYKPSISQGGWYCEEHGYKSVYITQLEAQELRNSGIAQAEMRGRISELESLSSFLQADIQRSLKENGLSIYPENTYPYKEEIEKRLDQLRAQESKNGGGMF